MVGKTSKKHLIILTTIILVAVLAVLLGINYATDNNHYVVDVVKESAVEKDSNMQITETIIKGSGEQYFDSKELDYEVVLKNISQGTNVETQVAILVDTSYSMQINDTNNVVKTKANELATGILSNVTGAKISISNNNNVKQAMTNTASSITSAINALTYGDGNDSNQGLDNAKGTFTNTSTSGNDVNKFIIVFTDATDDVSAKMQELVAEDPNLKIISILVDMTSTSYIVDSSNVCGDVYLLLSELTDGDVTGITLLDNQKIYDELNRSTNNIVVNNVFSDEILTYFNISNYTTTSGTIEETDTGYIWRVDRISSQKTAKMSFKLTLKSNVDIDAGVIFQELCTNKTQDVEYEVYNNSTKLTFNGTDSREGTESTVIKICQGYDLKIKAVNESNTDLAVSGVEFKVVGIDGEGNTVCELTKTTDSDGYITITADEARSLRSDGTITYTVTPKVNLVGYVSTDSVVFGITNDKVTRKLVVDDMESGLEIATPDEEKRLITVTVPINSQRADFEIRTEEFGNSNVTISGCKFELIQPKLNNKYEMEVLDGITDENGTVHFAPTVMTKDGSYNYILRQVTAPDGYDVTALTLISITYKDGIITSISHQFNDKVTTEICENKDNHVLVTVKDESLYQDPFDLQINLEDNNNGTKLEGVTYLVTTVNSNNQTRSEYVVTDENGQINTKVYGTGNLIIKITEQAPKVGYIADKNTKNISIQRNNGVIDIWDAAGLTINQNSDKTNIEVSIKSVKKPEQNIVRVSLVETEENDVGVGRDIVYTLIDTETGVIYGPAVSDRNGNLAFTIDTKAQGQHRYTLKVDKNSIPEEYDAESVASEINFNLVFDEAGYMIDENVIDDATIIDNYYSKIANDTNTEYTCFIAIGYDMNSDNTVNFKVQLNDKDQTSKVLEGAKYNIDIEWDINGTTRTKTIKERKTNSLGYITTRIFKGDEVRIYVTQVGAMPGYTVDNTTQEIYLTFKNNGDIKIVQSPYDRGETNTEEPLQGAYTSDGIVIYQHLNTKRSNEDTYVNLTVNKIDTNGAYVDGVIVNFKSETLKDKGDNPLDVIMKTENGGTIAFDYQEYILDNINKETIRVPGIGTEAEEIVYDLEISEMKLEDPKDEVYEVKDGTTVKLRLIFRLDTEQRVRLTNVETIYGNRLVKNKQFSSSSDNEVGKQEEDSLGIYLSNIILDLYTNYDDVGNLSLDFKKQNNNEEELFGAEYDIKIVNPDATVINKHITIDNGEDSNSIELKGVSVNVGSYIYITETKAPVGYGINKNAETLEVKAITDDGEVVLEHIDKTYNPDRLKLTKKASEITAAGGLKTNYEINLIDYQLDTFEFQIEAIDSNNLKGVEGYIFKVSSSLGAQGTIRTGSLGSGSAKIGGNVENKTITYSIGTNKAADYYKLLNKNINVNVVFDVSGNIDVDATKAAQTDTGYGTIWAIDTIEPCEPSGMIRIRILVEHQDPLVVNVETVDKITNTIIKNISYKVEPSLDIPGTGEDSIEVGYVLETGLKTYTLKQTEMFGYKTITDKKFTIDYQDGKIAGTPTIVSDRTEDTITKTGDREVKIKVYIEPKVPFEITNLYYFNNSTALQDSNFEITEISSEDMSTGKTNDKGIAAPIYAGILGTSEDKIYKVRQTKGDIGYATVDDFYVKISFDENREITSTELVDKNGDAVTNNRFVTVSNYKNNTLYNKNDKGIVAIQVLNYPEFKINIENVDRRNETIKIAGTEYSVTSKYTASDDTEVEFTSTSGVITNKDGLGIAHLDRTKDNTVVTYTVKEDLPATGYQSLGTDINVIVTFDSNGYVSNVAVENDSNLSKIESVSKIDPVVNPEDNFVVNLQLKNNPILKFNITGTDRVDNSVKIKDLGFQIVSKYNDIVYSNSSATNKVNKTGNPETSYTNIDGYTAAYLDRTLDNQDMYYTITEVQKSPGYDWIDEEIIIKVTYDSNGKISSITPVKGETYINITSYDVDNFEINIDIYNDEIKEFGIHLNGVDTYDKNKKLNDMKVEAFLTEPGNNSYVSDGKYELVGANSLLTGADRNADGAPDLTYGEDYLTIGQYTEGEGTRTLRLVIKNDSYRTKQSGYYLDSSDGTATGNSIGHYRGSKYYTDAKYQTVEYQYLIDVTFSDEGKITDAKIRTGLNNDIGWLVDDRYLEVSHTNYKLNITMKFFPMFGLKVSGMDNYTFTDEINNYRQPISLPGTKYTVTTMRHSPSASTLEDEYVTAGYIGYGHDLYHGRVYGNTYEDTDELFVPIENNYTRLFYVFEEIEPTNYQKYTDRYITLYIQRLVAVIQVTFNEYGEIDYDNSIVRKVDENIIHPYMDEAGTKNLSSNNIKEYNYYYDKEEANRNINFYIGYGLTTKINVTAVDDISGRGISNIRMYPFVNKTYCTNTSYEYNTIGYRDTNKDGQFSIKYWGGATQDNVNQYIIGSSRIGSNYNGYLFPSDMASAELGGSGNAQDYYAKLDVTYDENGKISNVQSIGADLWGDDNIKADITWDSATGNINITMLYSRKFQMALNKTDYYDGTINDLIAQFDIISNKGLKTQIDSSRGKINIRTLTPIGKIYKDTTVKYTLSETQVPDGYYPISNTIDFYVTFDKNGNIGKHSIISDSEYFETVSTTDNTEKANKTSADLIVNIKNKPAFNLDIRVIDQFYKKDGLKDAYLRVTSDKGDIAAGNPQTGTNGYANIIAGPVYPGETVTYDISQTNTVNGYYPNTTVVKLQVKFNDAGKIKEYKVISGNEVINDFNSTEYNNTRKISMQIMNMPKDLKIGLYKYDKTTDLPMAGVSFTITKTDMNSGETSQETIITETNGAVIQVIDTFNTSLNGKTIKYAIHEDNTPASYRTMEDVVYIIRYNADGSMASCNQIANDSEILNEKVKLNMATDGVIRYLNDERVHFNVTVPNDNAFDLIIKNEDTNYSGFGIEGSKFDVSINGITYAPELTNENGMTIVPDVTESGEITINIAQNEAGDGYKFDIDNKATIKLQKGIDIYSLDLDSSTDGYIDNDNATTTKAIIKVDETYGTITVTFKNETKTELTLFKQDINTKQLLQGAEFEITAQQLDNELNEVGDAITLTTEDNKITNSEGKLYFELGVAPQSQIWRYTFKEITPPEGYNPIADLTMTVTYDQYGRISKQESNKESRLIASTEHKNNKNCRNMYAFIYNGDVSPAYTVKVVTEDAYSGRRINDSKVQLKITEAGTDNLIKVEPKTSASMNNGGTSRTGNLGMDGTMYTDKEIETEEKDGGKGPIIIEKGLVYIDNVDYEGTININVSEIEAAPGYTFGSHKTDGNIKVKATYVPHLDDDPTVEFTVEENDGIDVNVNNANRVITIKILNDSRVVFDITTIDADTENKENVAVQGISGVNYTITSEILTAVDSLPTDLNKTSPLSDENGKTSVDTGIAYAGKTVLYTIHQNMVDDYNTVDDIQIEVKYDLNGYIKYYELLSSENNVSIEVETGGISDEEKQEGYEPGENDIENKRKVYLTVRNRRRLGGYTVQVEKHAMDTINDELAYDRLLSGAKYRITVEQETGGTASTSWITVTGENGITPPVMFYGYGFINITIEELEAPVGYKVDTIKYLKIRRNPITGEIQEVDSTVNWNSNENSKDKVILKPIDEQLPNKFTLVVNKYSTATDKLITENQAEFKATLQKEEDGEIVYLDTIDNFYTDKDGKAIIDNIDLPQEEGNYKLSIIEVNSPEGYELLTEPIELNVELKRNAKNEIIINTITEENDKVTILKIKDQLIALNIGNDVIDDLGENEYSLDITKVDGETNRAIENMAIFKVWLPDSQNTSVYTETMETLLGPGKLDYCYIEQDKDYEVRLTHMKKPTSPGTYVYKFKEVVAPEGYALIEDELILTLEFEQDSETGEIYIANATSSDENFLRINTEMPCNTDKLSIDILNNTSEQTKFTVKYDANDDGEGTVVPENQTKEKGIDLTLSTTVPTREGYTFKGWTTIPTDTNVQFTPGSTYTLDQDITLYAVWEEDLYLKSTEYLIGNGVNPNGFWNPGDETQYKEGDLYIKGIRPQSGLRLYKDQEPSNAGTYLPELLSNLTTNADEIKVYIPEKDESENIILKDENIVGDSRLIGTGMIIKLTKGEQEIQLTLIVRGDLLSANSTVGNGRTDNVEAQRLRTLTGTTLTKNYTIEEQQAIDYFINTDIRWNVNKQAINNAYQTHTLKPIR